MTPRPTVVARLIRLFAKTVRARTVLFYGAGWLVLGLSLYLTMGNWPGLDEWRMAFSADILPVSLVFVASYFIATVIRSWRFTMMAHGTMGMPRLSLMAVFPWLYLVGTLTPFRVGDVALALWVQNRGGSVVKTLGVMMAERFADSLVLIMMATLAITALPAMTQIAGLGDNAGAFSVTISALVLIVYLALTLTSERVQSWLERALTYERFQSPLLQRMIGIGARLMTGAAVLSQLHVHLIVLVLTIGIWGTSTVGIYIFLEHFFPDLPWYGGLLVMVAVNFSALFAITPGNVGLYQLAVIAALAPLGKGIDMSFVAAVSLQVAYLAANVGMGIMSRLFASWLDRRPIWEIV